MKIKRKEIAFILAILIIAIFVITDAEEIVWRREEKKIAITFDDGPDEKTTKILLDGLKARGIHASFFVIGEKAQDNKDLIIRMHQEGHLIGNHTYSHMQLNALSTQQACAQVKAANDVLKEIIKEDIIYLRPPYGEWNRKEDCPQNMIAVYWDIDPLDWKRTDAKEIARDIINQAEPGDIILLHDIYQSSVEAAFIVIDELQRQGYEFVTVEELLFV